MQVVLKTSEEQKLRQAGLSKQENKTIVLNGRAALAAGKDDLSSSDDDDENSTKHKFSQPDHAKIMIESKKLIDFFFFNELHLLCLTNVLVLAGGKIPDAATIHAARKRRQRARELGTDYIPIDSSQKSVLPFHIFSRLNIQLKFVLTCHCLLAFTN